MRLLALVLCLLPFSGSFAAAEPGEYATTIPAWFTETFLDFREDVADAAKQDKRLMLYFGQDGCPYCKELMQTNFSQKSIADKTRKHFTAIALNIWGDREVTWTDGRTFTEKRLAAFLRIQFTPTLLFLDEHGRVTARLNGYYPPHEFEAALDWIAARPSPQGSLAQYLRRSVKEAASPALHDEPFFLKPPYDLRRRGKNKPLAVFFETPFCTACDELHQADFRRPEIARSLREFDVARFALGERTMLITPAGERIPAEDWARSLGIAYAPSVVLFGTDGGEAFRIESYLRPFHLAGAFDYVSSGAYRREPSFQRFLQDRAEARRHRGEAVDLWR
jgi:thioredoxin-related protein